LTDPTKAPPTPPKGYADKIGELQRQHGRIAHVEVDGKLYVFRCPTLDEWEDHQERVGKVRRGPLLRELAQSTCVHPDLEQLQGLFQAHPGVTARIGDVVAELAGADIEFTVKKG
jgi:hypothetical protein